MSEAVRRLFRFRKVFSSGTDGPPPDALVIEGETIRRVGRFRDLMKSGFNGDVEDYSDQYAYPGWVDPHAHLLVLAGRSRKIDLSAVSTVAAAITALKKARTGDLIAGVGLPPAFLKDGPSFQKQLDEAFPDRAVIIETFDAHAVWLNWAAARRLLSIENPSGVLLFRDRQMTAIMQKIRSLFSLSLADLEHAARECLRYGITTVTEAALRAHQLALFRQCISRPLSVDVVAAYAPQSTDEALPQPVDLPHLKLKAVKLFMDGALTSGGLWNSFSMKALPSADAAVFPLEFYRHWLRKAGNEGWDIWIHAIGDAAVTAALDLMEEIPSSAVRRVEHLQFVCRSDLRRFRKLNAIPSVQPFHRLTDAPMWRDVAIPAHILAYAYGEMYRTDPASVAVGSDFPIVPPDPLLELYAATDPAAPWGCRFPDGASAIRAMTLGAARSLGLHDRGDLRSGHKADIVAYDVPLETVLASPDNLPRPTAVWKNGRRMD